VCVCVCVCVRVYVVVCEKQGWMNWLARCMQNTVQGPPGV
jgi:hypothetical protein